MYYNVCIDPRKNEKEYRKMKIGLFSRLAVILTTITAILCSLLGIPYYASGERLDMSKFELSFEDEFDTLDRSVWSGHYTYGDGDHVRRGGYWNSELAYAADGVLTIPMMYRESGLSSGGAGWYSAGIDTDDDAPNGFSQKYGYFEVRCILPKCADCWAAFWLLNDGAFNVGSEGRDGTEIDVFESAHYGESRSNVISSNLHYDGYEADHRMLGAKKFLVKGDPYSEFNTYGVEWNEKEYIFYINGVESFRTDFGGVSQEPEYMILSLEVSGDDGVFSGKSADKTQEYDFIVDYVRAYKYKDA